MPKYKVWCPELGDEDDARECEGFDHEAAAAEWAEWYDVESADYPIVSGDACTVHVQKEGELARRVRVTGRLAPVYIAHLVLDE